MSDVAERAQETKIKHSSLQDREQSMVGNGPVWSHGHGPDGADKAQLERPKPRRVTVTEAHSQPDAVSH